MTDSATRAGELSRLSAFTRDPAGGNPAGVWIGDALPDAASMQRIAAEVGYSETAFVAPARGRRREIRYYSPLAEVSFCGHATIAAGVRRDGVREAALTSVEPRWEPAPDALLTPVLDLLGWRRDELDPAIPPARAYAGAWHLVLAAARRRRLDTLDYDFDALQRVMLDDGLTTLQLVWRESDAVFHARDPFPVGGQVEDPATGAAAAALGGYLREAGLVAAPHEFLIRQGETMGRPSRIHVTVPVSGGIVVSGTAVPIPEDGTATA